MPLKTHLSIFNWYVGCCNNLDLHSELLFLIHFKLAQLQCYIDRYFYCFDLHYIRIGRNYLENIWLGL